MSQQTPLLSTRPAVSGQASVSVVVPSYNHARFVEATLRSIVKQTLAPSELIVIDDGSTDGSPEVIERVLKTCPFRCELIVRANRGLCTTLNEGLSRSRGRYFAYLGSDDMWLPGFLQARVRMLEAAPRAVLGYGHCYLIDEQNRIVNCTKEWATYADGDAREMLLQTVAPMSPTVLYRREPLGRHGWHAESRLEDYDLYLHLCAEGEFAFDRQVLSAWRQHGHNTSRNQLMMLEEQLQAQRRVLPHLGLSAREIDRLQVITKFHRAEDFLRIGEKAQALSLISHNLSGARSARSIMRMVVRLLLPYRLVQWRMERAQRRAIARYGTIQF